MLEIAVHKVSLALCSPVSYVRPSLTGLTRIPPVPLLLWWTLLVHILRPTPTLLR
jgi:hypothetical protein